MLIHTLHDAVCRKRDSICYALVNGHDGFDGERAETYWGQRRVQGTGARCSSDPMAYGGPSLSVSDVAPLSRFVDAERDLGVGAYGAEMEESLWGRRGGLSGGSFACSRGCATRTD